MEDKVFKRRSRYCIVPGCSSNSASNVSFHLIPKDVKRAKLWKIKCRIEGPMANKVVCGKHFEATDFLYGSRVRRTLRKNVVPSLNLPIASHTRFGNILQDKKRCERLIKRQSTIEGKVCVDGFKMVAKSIENSVVASDGSSVDTSLVVAKSSENLYKPQTSANTGDEPKERTYDMNDLKRMYSKNDRSLEQKKTLLNIRQRIKELFESFYSFSSDIWINHARKRVYVSMSVHHLDNDFKQHDLLIGMRYFRLEQHTPEKVYAQFRNILSEYGTEDDVQTILANATVFLTPETAIAEYMKPYTALPTICACQSINELANELVDEPCFRIKALSAELLPFLKIPKPKLVTRDLPKWQNVYSLLKVFLKARPLLMKKNKNRALEEVQKNVQLLYPFYTSITQLTNPQRQGTISEVLIHYKMLQQHVEMVKKEFKIALLSEFPDLEFYKICMALDPSNKDHMSVLSVEDLIQVKQTINNSIQSELTEIVSENVINSTTELDRFMKVETSDNLDFWRSATTFPRLRELARKYLSVPTSLPEVVFHCEQNDLAVKDLESMLIINSAKRTMNI